MFRKPNLPTRFTVAELADITQGTARTVTLKGSDNLDSNYLSTSSFAYESYENGLKSTQQLKVDWTKFENHTFFNYKQVSGLPNIQAAADGVYSSCILNISDAKELPIGNTHIKLRVKQKYKSKLYTSVKKNDNYTKQHNVHKEYNKYKAKIDIKPTVCLEDFGAGEVIKEIVIDGKRRSNGTKKTKLEIVVEGVLLESD